jgi:uncharacterized protein DUF4333
MIRPSRTMFLVAACVVALAGCSASTTTKEDPTLSKETLEKGITDSLEKAVGQRPDSVECPGSLKAEKGEHTRCVLSADNVRYGLTATITSYDKDNGSARYDIQVDEKPQT